MKAIMWFASESQLGEISVWVYESMRWDHVTPQAQGMSKPYDNGGTLTKFHSTSM